MMVLVHLNTRACNSAIQWPVVTEGQVTLSAVVLLTGFIWIKMLVWDVETQKHKSKLQVKYSQTLQYVVQ